MVSTILRESNVSPSEVESELQALAAPSKSAARNVAIVVGSLVLFVLIGGVSAGVTGMLVVITVLLVHESGHLVAMKLFGYRDVRMFFIPLFGAAVSGTETNPSGSRRALVSLSGPVPGIVLGIVCAAMFHWTGRVVFMEAARVFLLLNTFNLLPLVPLDGGRYVEAVLFSRTPRLQAAFAIGAALLLAWVALESREVLLGFLAFAVLASVRPAYLSSRLAAEIRCDLVAQDEADSALHDKVPSKYIERLISLLEQRLPEQLCTARGIATAIRNIWTMVWFKPPSVIASAALLLLYLACFATGLAATVGAEVSFQRAARLGLGDRAGEPQAPQATSDPNQVVFVTEQGGLYHHQGCPDLARAGGLRFYAPWDAEQRGLKPHDCVRSRVRQQ